MKPVGNAMLHLGSALSKFLVAIVRLICALVFNPFWKLCSWKKKKKMLMSRCTCKVCLLLSRDGSSSFGRPLDPKDVSGHIDRHSRIFMDADTDNNRYWIFC